jgi:hypothetical protein
MPLIRDVAKPELNGCISAAALEAFVLFYLRKLE